MQFKLVLQHASQTEVDWLSLLGQSPWCSKLFRLWAAGALTLSVSWFASLGYSTGWQTERSKHQRTVVILWTSQWRGCRYWKI